MKSRVSLVSALCVGVLILIGSTAQAQTPTVEGTPVVPNAIPLFPLPSSVLFPDVSLPLRVFEPRYRAMVEAALQSDRIIGIVLLRSGFEGDREDNPPVY